MKKHCQWLWLSVLLCSAVCGCNENNANHSQPPAGDDPICDPPCLESQVCIESSCHPIENLCGGKACAQNEQCVQDDCVPITVDECTPGCTEGTECIGGKCEPIESHNCGEENCTDEQTCYQEHCINNADLCGDTVCSDNQKCVENECIDKNGCDDKQCEEPTRCVLNSDNEGVCLEEACIVNDAPKPCDKGQECRAGICTDIHCEDGTIDEQTGKCIIPINSIELDQTELALLRDSSVTISANILPKNATNTQLEWHIKNVSTNSGKNDDIDSLAELTQTGASATIKSKSIRTRDIEVTATTTDGTNLSAKATIELKPYTDYKYPYDDNRKGLKEHLICDRYDDETTIVFNHDLYKEYVYPLMLKKGDDVYGTRASVVAAARFLTLQFPYFFNYHESSYVSDYPLQGHYIWTSGTKASNAQDVRIFGLNLTPNAYNDYRCETVIKKDVTPWGCPFPNKKANNGLDCSGFVTWSMRNGRFYAGDWITYVWGYTIFDSYKTGECKSKNKAVRNFHCKNIIQGDDFPKMANRNNVSDSVHAKFDRLNDQTDFLSINDLDEAKLKEVKAGDLLWYDGHVAMIIGMDRNADGTLKWMYVGEGSWFGNDVVRFSVYDLMNCSRWAKEPCIRKKEDGNCERNSDNTCKKSKDSRDAYVIKMDNVYNYYSETYGIPEDGNTYKYTDMWPQ